MNVLVLGADGMLGYDLVNFLQGKAADPTSQISIVTGLTHKQCDVTKQYALGALLSQMIHYDWIINCTAYTNTSLAETAEWDKSYLLNALAPKFIAQSCKAHYAKLLHVSTDYVFSEHSFEKYRKLDPQTERIPENINPIFNLLEDAFKDEFPCNLYGLHKLLGEKNVQLMMKPKDYIIARTSWLYGNHKNKSFVHRFVRNVKNRLAEEQEQPDSDSKQEISISVPDDQYSVPTSTSTLCSMIHTAITAKCYGIMNLCDGIAPGMQMISRFDFAEKILARLKDRQLATNIALHQSETKPAATGQVRQPMISRLPIRVSLDRKCAKRFDDAFPHSITQDYWKHDLAVFLDEHLGEIWKTM